jgi:Asp/Glu/hydantoin racemase
MIKGELTGGAKSGKAGDGAAVGILMLDTKFARPVGDAGCALTWPFPVLYKTVAGASPDLAVRKGAAGLTAKFAAAGRELAAAGVDGIVANCGFLAPLQGEIAKAAGVPVAASPLSQLPMVEALLPAGRRAGVVTISKATLSAEHLIAAGAAADTPIAGVDGGAFSRRILDDDPSPPNDDDARADILRAGRRLKKQCPALGAVILECTNMPPFAAALRDDLRLPVFDIYSFVLWFQAGLCPRRFS